MSGQANRNHEIAALPRLQCRVRLVPTQPIGDPLSLWRHLQVLLITPKLAGPPGAQSREWDEGIPLAQSDWAIQAARLDRILLSGNRMAIRDHAGTSRAKEPP